MTQTHEVISVFLDDEPFDAAELRAALEDPTGRELLIDLVALRQMAQLTVPEPAIASERPARVRVPWRWLLAAAALIVAVAGGFFAGRHLNQPAELASTAPAATRTIDIRSAEWQEAPAGAVR